MKRFSLIALVSGTILATGLTAVSAAPSDKVTVCHVPPGNPSAAHTITVGAPAVNAHLGHGDTLGACDGPYSPLFGE